MLPFIEISRFFWDYDTGTFIYKDPTELLNALGNHKIMIMLDEPFWWIRQACQNGKPQACSEIDSGYYNTREFFKNIKLSSGFQMMHVEAYADEAVVIDQLNNYFFLFENYRSIVSGIGVFVWAIWKVV